MSPSGFSSYQQSGREDGANNAEKSDESADLGLGYSYFDVGDEDGEGESTPYSDKSSIEC
jgi:hypothetical protein